MFFSSVWDYVPHGSFFCRPRGRTRDVGSDQTAENQPRRSQGGDQSEERVIRQIVLMISLPRNSRHAGRGGGGQ